MKRRFKTRKRKKKSRITLILITALISGIVFFKYLTKSKRELDINKSIAYLSVGLSDIEIKDFEFLKPRNLLYMSLNYLLEGNTEYKRANFLKREVSKPIVYIYNSHPDEEYQKEKLESYSIPYTVKTASFILEGDLRDYNIEALVEKESVSDYLKVHGLKYSKSYEGSRYYLNERIKDYSTLKYFIDLHRDSATKESTTISIDGTNYAKIAFVVGLDYSNYEQNLDFARRLNARIDARMSKGIIEKTGPDVNGVYNQDLRNNMVLIEVGGSENTIEEVSNTLKVFSKALFEEITNER